MRSTISPRAAPSGAKRSVSSLRRPRTMTSKEGFLSLEVVMLVEKAPNSDKRYEYRLYATTSEKKMRAEIEKAEAEGFTLAGMVSRGQHMVIMEREYGKGQSPSEIP